MSSLVSSRASRCFQETAAFNAPAKGSVFNSSMVLQVDDWAAYPGGATGSPPSDWERYALLGGDVATIGEYSAGMRETAMVNRLLTGVTSRASNNSGTATIKDTQQEVLIFHPWNTGACS